MTPVILSHEYPADGGGGIAAHVRGLARALCQTSPSPTVHVIGSDPHSRGYVIEDGVGVHRIGSLIAGNNMLNWALAVNAEFVREAAVIDRTLGIGVLHAHDWITVPAAVAVKSARKVPFVLTLHSTEGQRCGGIRSDYSRAISSIEAQGVQAAGRVIVNSEDTKREVVETLHTPPQRVETIEPYRGGWAERVWAVYRAVSGVGDGR